MLRPVGPLPAAVYWRRRALVLTLLLSVLGGGGWLAAAALTGQWSAGAAAASVDRVPAATPSLVQVLPPVAGVRVPVVPAAATGSSGSATAAGTSVVAAAAPSTAASTGASTGPCADAQLVVALTAPASVTAGTAPTFDLVVTDSAALPCVADVTAGRREVVLLDGAGARVWSSADCGATGATGATDQRTLAAGERTELPIAWDGHGSTPGCPADRPVVAAGSYLLEARLGTVTAARVPLVIG